MWALSLCTREPAVMGSFRKVDTLKSLCPSKKFFWDPSKLNVEKALNHWQQCTLETLLSHSQLYKEQNSESPFPAVSCGCLWCQVCKQRHTEPVIVQSEDRRGRPKSRAVVASAIRERITTSHLFVSVWGLCKHITFRYSEYFLVPYKILECFFLVL